ncbi:MAG: DUF262 domain-containing protein [Sulfuricellaceae bacterium]
MSATPNEQATLLLNPRPEAKTFSIQDLLDEVLRGKVRIPRFQRGLKWDRNDAKRLLDSLYRGYPAGALLLWETDAKADKIQFGSLILNAPNSPNALWVVDGQQRIVSLSRMLLAPSPDQDDFALYFDLEEPGFVTPPNLSQRQNDLSRWLPMTAVLDSEKLMQWLLDHAAGSPKRREIALQLGRRIREYEIPAYIVRSDDESILRDIFNRINSSGKKLDDSDVFDALNGSRSESKPATVEQISTELEKLDFGHIEEKILYRLLRVLQGFNVISGTTEPPRLTEEDAEQAYRQTTEAATSVMQFLKSDVGIPHYDLLPYKQPLVTLGKFFHHHPQPSPRSRELLARWIWRGALNGAHQGDTVSTRNALLRIMPKSEQRSIEGMLEMVKQKPSQMPNVLEKFNFRYAGSKLLALAFIDIGPRNLETGNLLDVSELFIQHQSEKDASPLQQIFTNSIKGDKDLLQSAANRLFHSKQAGLRKLLIDINDPEVLLSHGITLAAKDSLNK